MQVSDWITRAARIGSTRVVVGDILMKFRRKGGRSSKRLFKTDEELMAFITDVGHENFEFMNITHDNALVTR
jgi:hypothetical protein